MPHRASGILDPLMATKKSRRKNPSPRTSRPTTARARPRFVGREASPVLDRYPPKEVGTSAPATLASRPSAPVVSAPAASATGPSGVAAPSGPTAPPLITLDRPFDVDEFSKLLGETSIRVTVPRESLAEVLQRVLEFMGFGIYVYSISVRPAPAELLKSFVVELQRVDYSAEKGAWAPFVEKGTTDSPFGPTGDRT